MLKRGWTPDQISGRSTLEGYSYISYECIYNYIAFDRKKGGRLFVLLKRFGKRKSRSSRRIYGARGQIPGRIFIDKRPKIVERRARLGDLEADLIVGRNNRGYLLTLVDRVSRRVVLKKLKTKSKTDVFIALRKAIEEMKVAKTLTVDNGKEFANHREITRKTGARVFFTHPYTSHEKGTVENTNGLIRYHFPAETLFNRISEKRVKKVELKLNSTPRKVLNYLTPNEVHNRKLSKKISTRQCCT
jgi:IS30 family transposase